MAAAGILTLMSTPNTESMCLTGQQAWSQHTEWSGGSSGPGHSKYSCDKDRWRGGKLEVRGQRFVDNIDF